MHVQIPLPGPGQASVELLTFKLKARRGVVGRVKVRGTNDAILPEGIRAVAAITNRIPRTRITTFKVYVLTNNLAPASRRLLADSSNEVGVDLQAPAGSGFISAVAEGVLNGDCASLVTIGTDADTPEGALDAMHLHFELAALRSEDVQPSDPEAVLDHVIYNLCSTHGAETPDDGPG